jgi:hypothetical protein
VSAPFETRLLDLLPPVCREADAQGDLAAFLALPGAALDDLKALADRFPELFWPRSFTRSVIAFLASFLPGISAHSFVCRGDSG